jgi:hypothetical protein
MTLPLLSPRFVRPVKLGALRTFGCFAAGGSANHNADRQPDGKPDSDVTGHDSSYYAQSRSQHHAQSRVFWFARHNSLLTASGISLQSGSRASEAG